MDISGAWWGMYIYGGPAAQMAPVRFQADFSRAEAEAFTGLIVDADGLGEALVTGTQSGSSFQFVKTYHITRHRYHLPIVYQGSVSEDGLYLQGSWHIERKLFGLSLGKTEGVWGAQRPHLPERPLFWPPPQSADT